MRTLSALRCRFIRAPNRLRTYTTRPRRIPIFINTWNPTKPVPICSVPSSLPPARSRPPPRWNRETLRDIEGLTVPYFDGVLTNGVSDLAVRTANSMPGDIQSIISRLNQRIHVVAAARDASNKHINQRLWKTYLIAKVRISNLPSIIPDRAWDILWASRKACSQCTGNKRRATRRSDLNTLYQDMKSTGKVGTIQQRVSYLMNVSRVGKQEQALREWEEDRMRSDRKDRQDYKPEHLECGVHLYARAGHLKRAHEIMEELYRLYPTWDRSIMMTVFRAATRLEPEKHRQLACELYTQMKEEMLKPDLEMFDACFAGFLEARNPEHAKAVFKDMVVRGLIAVDLSEEQINGTLRRLNMLYGLGADIIKMTSITLHAINILPQSYHPHLFGDLMRSAVVMSAPEVITETLLLLVRRGFEPKTFDCNLTMRALLHTNKRAHAIKAETLGWHMIEALRTKGPANIRHAHAADAIARTKSVTPDWVDSLDKIPSHIIPQANATTCALLMGHHAKQGGWEAVDYLRRLMKELSIPPNTDVMNAFMDIQYRQGGLQAVWDIYTSLTCVSQGSLGVFPDGSTFRCLWKTLRLAVCDSNVEKCERLPNPRRFLAETVRWWSLVRSRHDAERFRIGLAAPDHQKLYKLVLHCFGMKQDLPGFLVAMHALRKHFDLFPLDEAVSILHTQLAWVDYRDEEQSSESMSDKISESRFRRGRMVQIYDILKVDRLKRMNLTDDQFATLDTEEVGEMTLNLMSEFIRVVMKRTHPPEVVESLIDDAKTEIGLPDMSTGDLDASSTV